MNKFLMASAVTMLLSSSATFAQDAAPQTAREQRLQQFQDLRERLAAKPPVEPEDAEAAFVESLPELPADFWKLQVETDAVASAWAVLNGGNVDPNIDCCAELVRSNTDNTQYVGAIITDRPCWRVSLRDVTLISDGPIGTPIARPDSRRDLEIWLEPTSGRLLKIHAFKPGKHESEFRELDRLDATRRISSSNRERWMTLPEKPPISFCEAISNADVKLSDETIAVFVHRNTVLHDDELVWSVECRTIPGPAPKGELREPQWCWRTVIGSKGFLNMSNGPGPRPAPPNYEKPMWWYLPHPPLDLPQTKSKPIESLVPVDQ